MTETVCGVAHNEATFTPRAKLTTSKPEELIVNGALVTDAMSRGIDGADNGQAGSDYIASISGSRVTDGGILLARIRRQPVAAVAVDHLLTHGELAQFKQISTAERIFNRPLRVRSND